ncbi:hypothetical protein [Streptomyces sp. NPDC059883]|uniref:hypothetical protein n=1 Tax=unclassified Streptomyces TaxID=2593676 RepID=UPI00365093FF
MVRDDELMVRDADLMVRDDDLAVRDDDLMVRDDDLTVRDDDLTVLRGPRSRRSFLGHDVTVRDRDPARDRGGCEGGNDH